MSPELRRFLTALYERDTCDPKDRPKWEATVLRLTADALASKIGGPLSLENESQTHNLRVTLFRTLETLCGLPHAQDRLDLSAGPVGTKRKPLPLDSTQSRTRRPIAEGGQAPRMEKLAVARQPSPQTIPHPVKSRQLSCQSQDIQSLPKGPILAA